MVLIRMNIEIKKCEKEYTLISFLKVDDEIGGKQANDESNCGDSMVIYVEGKKPWHNLTLRDILRSSVMAYHEEVVFNIHIKGLLEFLPLRYVNGHVGKLVAFTRDSKVRGQIVLVGIADPKGDVKKILPRCCQGLGTVLCGGLMWLPFPGVLPGYARWSYFLRALGLGDSGLEWEVVLDWGVGSVIGDVVLVVVARVGGLVLFGVGDRAWLDTPLLNWAFAFGIELVRVFPATRILRILFSILPVETTTKQLSNDQASRGGRKVVTHLWALKLLRHIWFGSALGSTTTCGHYKLVSVVGCTFVTILFGAWGLL
ncbi:hypothetical protein Tco_0507560 [Tanacetum coccineum]